MRKFLKYVTVIVYMFLILYLSNKFIEIKNLSKNIYYIIIVFPILLAGVAFIIKAFEKKDKCHDSTK